MGYHHDVQVSGKWLLFGENARIELLGETQYSPQSKIIWMAWPVGMYCSPADQMLVL